jgi:hypothetical protein
MVVPGVDRNGFIIVNGAVKASPLDDIHQRIIFGTMLDQTSTSSSACKPSHVFCYPMGSMQLPALATLHYWNISDVFHNSRLPGALAYSNHSINWCTIT